MSDSATMPEQPPVRVWRRVSIALAVLVVGLLAAGYVGNSLEQKRSQGALKSLEEELDENDPNWRLHDMEAAREMIPEGQNSAPVIMTAARLIPRGWNGQKLSELLDNNPLHPLEQLDQEQVDELDREMIVLAPSVTHGRKVADMPRGRHRLTHNFNPIATLLPDQSETRQVASVLRYDGLRRAQEGDIDGALRSARACINTGRSLGDEPLMISQLIRAACITIGCNLAERVLAQGEASDRELALLQQLLALEDEHETFRVAVRGERGMSHDLLGKLASGAIKSSDFQRELNLADGPIYQRWFGMRVTRRDQTENLKMMNKLVATTRLPEGERLAQERAIDLDMRSKKPSGAVWLLLTPASLKVAEACRRKTEQVRTLLVIVAIERYRLKHQKWPDSLNGLKPDFLKAVPTDPYDGKPLRYKKLADGVVVYSIGHDLADNGGNLDRKRSNAGGFDQGYQLWDVKERRKPARVKPAPLPEEMP